MSSKNIEDMCEVVRCKNCTNFERRTSVDGYCYYWDYEQGISPNIVDNNDYCSNGIEIKQRKD